MTSQVRQFSCVTGRGQVGGDGTGQVGDGLGRIGGVLVVFLRSSGGGFEGEAAVSGEVEGFGFGGAVLFTGQRPGLEAVPVVFAGVVDEDGRSVGFGCAFFEVLAEEGKHDLVAEVGGGVAVPGEGAEDVALAIDLAVEPGAHDEVVHGVGGVFGLEGAIAVDGSPHVFLIPEALKPHGRDGEGTRGDELVEGLTLPEGVVGGMRVDGVPVGKLVLSLGAGEVTG